VELTRVAPQSSLRTAVVWRALSDELARQGGPPVPVVDVGGGSGGFAVPLAEAGHRVTVVDPSPDALAALTRRAAEAGVADRITAVQGDGDRLAELVPAGSAGLVLCHSLLELVDDPAGVLRAVVATLRPGGAASVLVANQAAAVLARAMAGQLAAASALLPESTAAPPAGSTAGATSAAGVAEPPRRTFDAATVAALLTGAGFTLAAVHGVRVLADLIPATVAEADPAGLLALEARLSDRPPYRDIAAQLHLLARRPAGDRPGPASAER
jgi:ubiquinone/menaquinone biosynthesis C-methylase UbiE